MAYIDKSSAWVLDQFFTYLDANQLGSNDKHIVDTFSVEHNWNATTPDGTHKLLSASAIINTTPSSTGHQYWSNTTIYWTPSSGIYQMVSSVFPTSSILLQIYVSGAWQNYGSADGIIFCDGINMRFYVSAGGIGNWVDLYYQKF